MSQTDVKGHYPTRLDRWLLVRYKKFKTVEEIPNTVSSIMMRRVHDRARVHTSLIIMGVSFTAMFGAYFLGKRNAHGGDSMVDKVRKEQEAYNVRKNAEEAAKAKAT